MKNNRFVIGFFVVLTSTLLVACNKSDKNSSSNESGSNTPLESLEQKVSYIIAYDSAQRMDAEGLNLDAEVMRQAVVDFKEGREAALNPEEMQATMTELQTVVEQRREAQYNELAEKNQKASEAFLAENAKREGVVTTESGLQYEVIKAGEGKQPQVTDEVSVNYKGSLLSGEIFDQNDGVSFVVNQLIPGWVEALPLMKEGAKWKIYIPANLAYGSGGTNTIGPNEMIIFEMDLISVGTGAGESEGVAQ